MSQFPSTRKLNSDPGCSSVGRRLTLRPEFSPWQLHMVLLACNPSTWELKARRSLYVVNLRPAWATELVSEKQRGGRGERGLGFPKLLFCVTVVHQTSLRDPPHSQSTSKWRYKQAHQLSCFQQSFKCRTAIKTSDLLIKL